MALCQERCGRNVNTVASSLTEATTAGITVQGWDLSKLYYIPL